MRLLNKFGLALDLTQILNALQIECYSPLGCLNQSMDVMLHLSDNPGVFGFQICMLKLKALWLNKLSKIL